MLQQKKPDDYVVSTGKTYSVKNFAEKVFGFLKIKIIWKNKGIKEIGVDKNTGKTLIKIDPYYFRPQEVNYLKGKSTKAKKILKWKPKTDINKLVEIMVLEELKKHKT